MSLTKEVLISSLFSLFVCSLLLSRTAMDVMWIVLFISLMGIWLTRRSFRVPLRGSPFFIIVALVVIIWFASALWAIWRGYGDWDRIPLILKRIRSIAVLFVVYAALIEMPSWEKVWKPAIGVVLFISLYALYQHFTGIDLLRAPERDYIRTFIAGRYSAIGTFSHYITFAYVQSVATLFLWGAVLYFPLKNGTRGRLFFVFALSVLSVLFSYCRGAWLALGCSLLFLAAVKSRKVLLWTLLITLIGGGMGVAFNAAVRERVQKGVAFLSGKSGMEGDASVDHRLKAWQGSWELFRKYPYLGIGYGNYKLRREYLRDRFPNDNLPDHPHNSYLQMLSDCGLPGLLMLLFFIVFPLWKGIRVLSVAPGSMGIEKTLLAGGLGGIAFFAFHSLVDEPLASSIKSKIVWFSFAVVIAAIERINAARNAGKPPLPASLSS